MDTLPDRNPHRFIPPEFRQRSEAWIASATDVVSASDQFLYMAVENLMFAERPILQMEARLAQEPGRPRAHNEPLLLMECSSLSILWLFGLYEVTRGLKSASYPRWQALIELHKKLEVLRMPLAKHEVRRKPDLPHYPTGVWCPETGRVGCLNDLPLDTRVAVLGLTHISSICSSQRLCRARLHLLASSLCIREEIVQGHVKHIFSKLRVNDRS